MTTKTYTITKRIAKHGSQAIIVIPSALKEQLAPSMLVKITIDVLKEGDQMKGGHS